MGYKVLIPTAGTGSRLGGITKYLNKSLVSLGNKPAISRIIDLFPEDTRFVIATGYKGLLVKEFIHLAYPERKFQFVDILLYEGEGSGLGLTVKCCKEYLQEPFVFCSCDTLVNEPIPAPTFNWMGYDHRDLLGQYRTLNITENSDVESINEKGADKSSYAKPYIGLAGVYDWQSFWQAMEEGGETAVSQGESYGMRALLPKGIKAQKFTWFDTGVKVELEATRHRFIEPDTPNILEKSNEAIWFLDNRVIKFSDNVSFISDRIKRAKLLRGFVPKIIANTTHMYCYDYAEGDVLSKCVSQPVFKKLLKFSEKFWVKKELSCEESKKFKESCLNFYKTKTYDRINQFYKNFSKEDNAEIINEVECQSLKDLLGKVDWEYVSDGLPGQFHGDYHFENIIYNKSEDVFKFIDWRQSFEKSIDIGDIYYDFAKLNHGLIVCHELIAKDLYTAKWDGSCIRFDFARKQRLVECELYFYHWLEKKGYDVKKVKLLTALIFLNIAALHHFPYCILLYALGKKMLGDSLQNMGKSSDNEYME